MTDFLIFIPVMKYRHKGQEAITEKIGRLNLHSIRKKTQRVSQRLNQVTGIATQVGYHDDSKSQPI